MIWRKDKKAVLTQEVTVSGKLKLRKVNRLVKRILERFVENMTPLLLVMLYLTDVPKPENTAPPDA